MRCDYAVYRGDTFLFMGTSKECANYLGVTVNTVYFYTTPRYRKRFESDSNRIIVIRVEEDDE